MLLNQNKTKLLLKLSSIIIITALLAACNKTETLFNNIPASQSGIDFKNTITENDSINPLDLEFLYNGGGVAVGDFNNDGLNDLYFTASTTSNKLYLNKGQLSFTDITETAGVSGQGKWCNAASVVDINSDGLQDIYVCASIKKNPNERKNLFYINQGVNKNGIPVFKDMAKEYNLADTSLSVQAAFFDYDNDGDLDIYMLTTKLAQRDASEFAFNNNNTNVPTDDYDKLYRNDFNPILKHAVFTDVSKTAGINHPGYGLGVAIADINNDGWKDIYTDNDFFGSDLLYINNHNGTFTESLKSIVKHTSQNAMGVDIADINNDGLADILSVDMNPEDNFRKKKNMNKNNYFIYQNMTNDIYMLQYVRNTLQLNQGATLKQNDSIGNPVFSDISFLAGVAETDWSWNPSIADFDNDGHRDILITNGYPKDVTDHDFAAFRKNSRVTVPKADLIAQMPQIKIPNYAFKNIQNLKFENVTKQWGFAQPSFSNGAVYTDLDNDGDLDYVINNINEKASLYQNTTNTTTKTNKNYLKIAFKGDLYNPNGLGAITSIYYKKNKLQVYENSPYRGYISTVDCKAFFGLNNTKIIDSVVIKWYNGKKQTLTNVPVNQQLTVKIANAKTPIAANKKVSTSSLFTNVSPNLGVNYYHTEPDFIDFNIQRLLPHKLSEYGPALASGDIDKNGLDDVVISGNGDTPPTLLLQQKNGKFLAKQLELPLGKNIRRPESLGTLLFDADGDNDLDLLLTSGSNQFEPNTANYQDWFFVNNGKGNFTFNQTAFPLNYTSKSCVKATDFDKDGDLDLFIGGRVLPKNYPLPVSSFIYRNDTKNGVIKFTDVSQKIAPSLKNIGLVCDAVFTDFDNDNWIDLVITGEWMSIQFFKNNQGKFINVSKTTGINNEIGWWNSITGGDFDNDGDIDYLAGNLGKNSFYKASHTYPVSIYAKDFDKNDMLDIITTVYLPNQDGELKEFPAQTRDDQVEQLPGLKKRFLTYKEFGSATINDIFREDELSNALKLQANHLESSYIQNLGNGKFKLHKLPVLAQIAPLYGMVTDDFNSDGNLDVAITGNDFGTEVGNGRYDALNGLVMLGNGKGGFAPQSILQSGLFIPGNGKALIKLRGQNGNYLLAASQNKGLLKIFNSNKKQQFTNLLHNDTFCVLELKNGKKQKQEFYIGNSYLSQSAPFISFNKATTKTATIVNNNGVKRMVKF